MNRTALLCVSALAFSLSALPATARATRPRSQALAVRQLAVTGALSRDEALRFVRRIDFTSCQNTWLGGDIGVELRVERSGALTPLQVARRASEEVAPYAPCVRRRISRARVAPQPADSVVRFVLAFPSLGLAP